MNTELYGIGEKYMSENKTIEQAKQALLDNIVEFAGCTEFEIAPRLAEAYKTLCEAQLLEDELEFMVDIRPAFEDDDEEFEVDVTAH